MKPVEQPVEEEVVELVVSSVKPVVELVESDKSQKNHKTFHHSDGEVHTLKTETKHYV